MIKAVIFDMDGVIIDSEPFWHESEIEAFGRAGLRLTREMCLETTGLRVDEIVNYWRGRRGRDAHNTRAIEVDIVSGVVERIRLGGELKEGVRHALSFFKRRGVPLALASSSPYRVIDAVLARTGLAEVLGCVHSAEEEEKGKPDPAVYLTAARKLGVGPAECLAIEDSLNGVLAAKALGMKCPAVADAALRRDPRLAVADFTLGSLAEVGPRLWAELNG